MTDDDRLHAIDSVHADDLGVRHHRKLAVVSVRGSAEASAKALHHSRVARTQHDEHAQAAPHSVDSRSECGSVVTGDDEIDGSGHRVAVAVAGACPFTTTGPLSTRKNASS